MNRASVSGSTLDYTPPPTIARFMKSDALARFTIGPLGCVSARTEVLTPSGWVRIDQWNGQPILQWHPDGSGHFAQPLRYIVEPCETLWRFSSSHSMCMELSDEHRVPYIDYKGQFRETTAGRMALKPSRRTIPTNFTIEGPGLPWGDTELRLRVAVAADGYFPRNSKRCYITIRKHRKLRRIRELLLQRGIDHDIVTYVRDGGAYETRVSFKFDRQHGKRMTDDIWWRANSRQMEIVIDELQHWDGLHDHEETRFFSREKREAELIQFYAHGCGRRATISHKTNENRGWEWYEVYISQPGSSKTNVMVRDGTTIEQISTEDGRKYCFETQTGYFVARCDDRVFCTGNSGKSMGMIMEGVRRMVQQAPDANGIRPTRGVVIRNTMDQIKQTCVSDIMQYLPQIASWHRSDKMIKFNFPLDDGTRVESEWLLVPLEDVQDVRRLLSLQLTFAWASEFRELNYDIVAAVLGRLGRYPSPARVPPSWAGLFAESNPFPEGSAWHDALVVNLPDNWAFFRQPGGLDPNAENRENLPEDYYERLINNATSEEWIRVHVHGEFGEDPSGQRVYRHAFSMRAHLHRSHDDHGRPSELHVLPDVPVIIGIDFGRTPACVFCQEDFQGRLRVLEECTSDDMHLEAFILEKMLPVIRARFASCPIIVVGDPAGMQRSQTSDETPFSKLKEYGFKAVPAQTNDPYLRISAVERRLLDRRAGVDGTLVPAMLIDEARCPVLVKGFKQDYRYKKRKTDGRLEDKPDKTFASHVHDALQYACLGAQSNYVGRKVMRMSARATVRRPPVPSPRAWT